MEYTEKEQIWGLFELGGICSDFLVLFPEELKRGDRYFTEKEASLCTKLSGEVCPQEMNRIARDIKDFSYDVQQLFPEEVKNAKRPMTPYECINFKVAFKGFEPYIDKDTGELTFADFREYYKYGSVGKTVWTEENRKDMLIFMGQIKPEEKALFPKDLQQGDRFFTHWEARLWGYFYDKNMYNWDSYEDDLQRKEKEIASLLKLIKEDIESGYTALIMKTLYDINM